MVRKGDTVKMVRADAGSVQLMKDSVAAHQAECGCHPVTFKSFGPIDEMGCCKRSGKESDATDGSGQPWHLDPLCKVRPEAKA
jgi:hypothetical protein